MRRRAGANARRPLEPASTLGHEGHDGHESDDFMAMGGLEPPT